MLIWPVEVDSVHKFCNFFWSSHNRSDSFDVPSFYQTLQYYPHAVIHLIKIISANTSRPFLSGIVKTPTTVWPFFLNKFNNK